MEAKHTPGPWKVCSSDFHVWIEAPLGDEMTVIATIAGVQTDQIEDANSRLIAAAPELLEALIVAQSVAAALKRAGGPAEEFWHDIEKLWTALIAKATKGEPK